MRKGNCIRKKIYLIIILATLILLCGCSKSDLLKINWGISMPKPIEIKIIHNFDFKEGDDIEIWKYETSKVEKIRDKNEFIRIDENNLTDIENYLNQYYEGLSYDESIQEKFSDNIPIEELVMEGNYYSLIKAEEKHTNCYLLMILDTESNYLYFLNHIR